MAKRSPGQAFDILLRRTEGSVSAEALSLLGVAVLGMAGFGILGPHMASSIRGDGQGPPPSTKAATLITSRQAGMGDMAEGAARFAEELAAANRASGPEQAARLQRMGAEIAAREATLPKTDLTDFHIALGHDFHGIPEGLRARVGKEGGLTEEQARYWLRGDVTETPVGIRRPLFRRGDYDAAEAAKPASFASIRFKDPEERASVISRLQRMPSYDNEQGWLHYDYAGLPEDGLDRLRQIFEAVQDDPALRLSLQDQGLRVAAFDLPKLHEGFQGLSYVALPHTLLVNFNWMHDFNLGEIMERIRNFAGEADDAVAPHSRGIELPPEDISTLTEGTTAKHLPPGTTTSGYTKHVPGNVAEHALRVYFGELLPAAGDAEDVTHAWDFRYAVLGGDDKFVELSGKTLSAFAEHDPHYAFLAKGDLPRYLEQHGLHRQAQALRQSGIDVRVDAVDFREIQHAAGNNTYTAKLADRGALMDADSRRIYLNLNNTRAWPRLLADFVETVTGNHG